MGASFTANEATTIRLKVPSLSDDGGHNKERERERGLVCPGGGRWGGRGGWREEKQGGGAGVGVGALIYVNNFHFPSAAVCITQHGPVVMAIATGQMMWKWVHLVMNLSSADGCLTRVHFPTIHNTKPLKGFNNNLQYWRLLTLHRQQRLFRQYQHQVTYKDFIRMYQGKANETRPLVYKYKSPLFLTHCPLVLNWPVILCRPLELHRQAREVNKRGYKLSFFHFKYGTSWY